MIEPVSGIKKLVFKVIEGLSDAETVQFALILNYPHTIGNGTVVSELVRYYDIEANMIADLTLGLNQRVDIDAELYKIVNTVQPIQLANGLYAKLLENVQVGINKGNIATNVTDIGTNITDIGTNVTNIGTNGTDIDVIEEGSLPVGAITMYSGNGTNLGTKWKICDGTNGTPDLRDKFVRGSTIVNIGNTGGSDDAVVVSHLHGQPSHTHRYRPNGGGGTTAFEDNNTQSTSSYTSGNNAIEPAGGHNVFSTGVSGTGKNLPTYYSLAYIMKIA